MAIEKNTLRLYKFEIDSVKRVLYCKGREEGVDIGISALPYLVSLREGSSISDIIQKEFCRGEKPDFQGLFDALNLLAYLRLLVDGEAQRYIRSLQVQYDWPASLLANPLAHVGLGSVVGGYLGKGWNLLLVGFLCLFTAIFSLAFIDWIAFSPSVFVSLPVNESLVGVFLVLISSVFLGQFFSSSIECFFKIGVDRLRWEWGLNVSLLGLGVWVQKEEHGDSFSGKFLWIYILNLLSVFFLFLLATMIGLEEEQLAVVWIGVFIYGIFSISPFAWTAMTKILKSSFNRLYGDIDQLIASGVTTLRILWVMALGLSILFVLFPFIKFVWSRGFVEGRETLYGALVIGYLLIFFISFLEDIVQAVDYRALPLTEIMGRWSSPQNEIVTESAKSENIINDLPFVRLLPVAVRDEMLKGCRLLKVSKGVSVCRQGASDRDLYIVVKGRLVVMKRFKGHRRVLVTSLQRGAVFGESGYFLGHRRSGDVVCEEESLLLCLKYRQHLNGKQFLDGEQARFLRHRIWSVQSMVGSPLFKEIPREAMDGILNCGKIVELAQGVHVINEGEVADSGYFVIQGQLDVVNGDKRINQMGTGDFFGEIALLYPGVRRTATVVARSPSILMCIEAQVFYGLLANHLPLALILEKHSAKRLQKRAGLNPKN